MLITSLEYSPYVGRIAVGKVTRGTLRPGMNVTLAKRDGVTMVKTRIKDLMTFEGLGKSKAEEVPCGEICAIVGIEGFEIGDTICDYDNPGTARTDSHRRAHDEHALYHQRFPLLRP